MTSEDKRIIIAIDSQTGKRLEEASSQNGKSVEQYCTEAIFKELNSEVSAPKLSLEEFIALGNEILKGRRSFTDSADLIREAREERHRNL